MSDKLKTVETSRTVFATQFELLKLELTLIDSAVRAQDDICKNIKNWAIVAWTATVGFTISNTPLRPFVFATAFIPLAFWIVDGSFRRVQRSFILRTREISDFLNSAHFISAASAGTPIDFDLMKMRSKVGNRTSWATVMRFKTVAALYLLLITGSILIHMIVHHIGPEQK